MIDATATVYAADGTPRMINARTTNTAGLIVHESLGDPGWVVTHERSGLFVAMFDEYEQTQAFARLLDHIDWTQSGAGVRLTPGIAIAVGSAKRVLGAIPTAGENNEAARAERMTA